MRVLVTGGAGLVGSECCKFFSVRGWDVISVDNYYRGKIFGNEADTRTTIQQLVKRDNIKQYEMDFRDDRISTLIENVDAVIHTAAQPSHPMSIQIPVEDFQVNAWGTLLLLECLRRHRKDAVFVFCSSNKVYGDTPNYFSYSKIGKRFEPVDPSLKDGFDENLRMDRCMHTPFGVSKAAGDLYTQEYARLYGLKTGVFRMGCITGSAAKAVEMHNWEPLFVKKALSEEILTIYGHEGYQVRDVIHAVDLAKLFYEFVNNPKPGEVYNVGGSRKNSISLLEAIDLIEEITGRRITYNLDGPREGDHIWWITNINKVRTHFSDWDVRIGLKEIFTEIHESIQNSRDH